MYTHNSFFVRHDDAPGVFWIDYAKYPKPALHALDLGRSIGYMYPYELLLMTSIVRSLPEGAVIINIGAGSGTSAIAMLEARPDLAATTYTVDIRDDDNPFGGLMNERNAFKTMLPDQQLPHQKKIDSSQAGREWPDDAPVDFCFVDGDHTNNGVTKDILAWKPHVKHGGFMMFHDYQHGFWPDVKFVVDEQMKDDILVAVVDISALFMIR